MEDEHIDDYISGIVQSCQFYLLEGNIHAALAHIISNLSALEETSDHPLKHQIVQQAQAAMSGGLRSVGIDYNYRHFTSMITGSSTAKPCLNITVAKFAIAQSLVAITRPK